MCVKSRGQKQQDVIRVFKSQVRHKRNSVNLEKGSDVNETIASQLKTTTHLLIYFCLRSVVKVQSPTPPPLPTAKTFKTRRRFPKHLVFDATKF